MADDFAEQPEHQSPAAGHEDGDVNDTVADVDIEIVEGMGEEMPVPAAVAAWLAEQPIGLGQVTGTGDNLLHLSAADGRVDVVEWLLEAGVDPRTEDYAGEDALTLAIRHAHYAVANLLIRYTEMAGEAVEVASVTVPEEHVVGTNVGAGAGTHNGALDIAPVAPAAPAAPAVPAPPTPGSSADETVDVAAPVPAKTDTRSGKSNGTGVKKRGITRDMYRREGTARHTGTYRRNEGSTNVAIVKSDPARPAADSHRTRTIPSSPPPFPERPGPAAGTAAAAAAAGDFRLCPRPSHHVRELHRRHEHPGRLRVGPVPGRFGVRHHAGAGFPARFRGRGVPAYAENNRLYPQLGRGRNLFRRPGFTRRHRRRREEDPVLHRPS